MCIAIYSPKGNNIPCEDYLRTSFENNSDGAGFAYNTDRGTVRIQKGFMDWDAFKSAFYTAAEKNDFKNRGVLIHFRITTHGGTCPECCHPFPITSDEGIMHKLSYESPYAVIHNGIVDLTSIPARNRVKMSDTMVFIEKYLTSISKYHKWFENPETMDFIYKLIDSKMAILNSRGEIKSTQGFTQDKDGNFYSNTSYKESRVKKFNSYNYYDYFVDYDDGYSTYGEYGTLSLMRMTNNMMFVCRDGSVYTYEDIKEFCDGEWAAFLDEMGELWVYEDRKSSEHKPYESEFGRFISAKKLQLFGAGDYFDSDTVKQIEFKETNYTWM